MTSAESLAMDCQLNCDMCDALVNYGDDYVTHLQIVHGITKNYNFFLNKALQNIKGTAKRKAECITLEEDDEDNDEDEPAPTNINQLNPKVKERLQEAVTKTMEELLEPIRNLLDGKVPLDSEALPDDINEDPFASDEKIWESFNKLKNTINNLEFPKEVIDSIINDVPFQHY